MMAVNEVTFTTSTVNIVQMDWASASTKVSPSEGYCTYWHESITCQ